MEGRMTICNMSIEGGARAGLVAPDDKTFAYLKDRPKSPKGETWDAAVAYWRTLKTDEGAHYDKIVRLDAAKLPPIVSWGTSPQDVVSVAGTVPRIEDAASDDKRASLEAALAYMGLRGGERITDLALDRVFIGSCTNGRIEDLREVAKIVEGKRVAGTVNAMIVPGSGLVKQQARERGGSTPSSNRRGFEWREPGCSMCLAMNPDKLSPGERCATTSEPQFRRAAGLQGAQPSGLAPAMAAAARRSRGISWTFATLGG